MADVRDADAAVEISLRLRPGLESDRRGPPGAIEAIATLRVELPETAVVALSGSYDEDEVFEWVRAGASGYLLRTSPPRACRTPGTRCSAASRPCVWS